MAYRSGFTFGFGMTPWVQRLIIANVLVFVLTYAQPELSGWLAFTPSHVLFQPWTIVTYMFVHGGFMHIFFNMLGLFFFGPPLESRWGSREFLKYYFLCGMGGAALSFVFVNNPIIGASAAVYGVMLAFAMNWPDAPIYIWGIFPIPAKILVLIFVGISVFSAFSGGGDGVAHFAHLGGFAAGFAYLKWERYRGPKGMRKFRRMMTRQKLTVVPGGQTPASAVRASANGPVRSAEESLMLDELDKVLDKINSSGISSLTAAERKVLDDASRRYRQN